MTKQAIIYTRFSPRPNAKECDSCEKQEERCIAYCKKMDYDPCYAIYSDKSISGGELNRPRLSAAINALGNGDILVVDCSDRLARDMLVNLTIRHQVEQAGARIEFADGSPPDTTPEGKLFQNILAAFAAYERDRIRLRTKNGLEKKRKNGERTTGKIPIGWMLDPKKPKQLVRCQVERNAIIHACWLSRQEKSYSANSKKFSSEEIATKLTLHFGLCRGKPWSARTVRKLIKRHAFWADPIDGDFALEPQYP